jgi:hypothetical protein
MRAKLTSNTINNVIVEKMHLEWPMAKNWMKSDVRVIEIGSDRLSDLLGDS